MKYPTCSKCGKKNLKGLMFKKNDIYFCPECSEIKVMNHYIKDPSKDIMNEYNHIKDICDNYDNLYIPGKRVNQYIGYGMFLRDRINKIYSIPFTWNPTPGKPLGSCTGCCFGMLCRGGKDHVGINRVKKILRVDCLKSSGVYKMR